MKRLRLLLVVSSLLLGLSACGGGDGSPAVLKPLGPGGSSSTPSGVAVPSAVPSTSTVPTARTPDVKIPDAGQVMTSEGAQAFATFYISLLSKALSTGDVQGLEALSEPGCDGCRQNIDSIRGVAARHEKVDGKDLVRVRYAVAPAVEDQETVVLINVDADEYIRHAADGSVVLRSPALNNVAYEMRCIWRSGAWRAAGFRQAVTQ